MTLEMPTQGPGACDSYQPASPPINGTEKVQILDAYGQPYRSNGNGKPRPHPERPDSRLAAIRAKYDLAQTTDDNSKHWGQADAYDSDSANSRAVRKLMIHRSRYETGNNGYIDGLTKTDATFVIRTGPRLRLTSNSENELRETALDQDQIKADWHRWCKAIQFRRKLWCMCHARIQDGESFGVIRSNPNVAHPVKLDLVLIEAEQCQTPMLPIGVAGYIDGIRFDPWGNPIYYDVLPQHPGALGIHKSIEPDQIPARYVLHWYSMERPGQHRGIPAFTSTLGLGATHRRFRGATVSAAETIANISLIAQTQGAPDDGPDQFAPFGSIEWQRNMMMMLPMGWNVFQPQGTQPPANYEMFMRAHIQELARPRSMPYNLAAADNSNNSFASGKLDLFPYYMVVDDFDRHDCNDLVLDKLFAMWWQEYVLLQHSDKKMLDADPAEPPDHVWDWPRNPIADEASEVRTNAEKLRSGQAAPSDIAHEYGQSYEEFLRRASRDWGMPVDDLRAAYFEANVGPKSGGTVDGAGEPGAGDGATGGGSPLEQVLSFATAKKRPRPVQNRTQPEPNGVDAPTLEQMSMLVGRLAEKVNRLCEIIEAKEVAA